MTLNVPPRAQQIRSFLQQNHLRAWLAWRPDELLMLSEYFPAWGASFLIYFLEAEPVLFVPVLEPRDHIPTGLRVVQYPWGDLKCSDPYAVLVSEVRGELAKSKAAPEQVGLLRSASRSSLPINAAEQIPFPENFATEFSSFATGTNARTNAGFAKLYARKTPPEIDAIRLTNRVANIGLRAFSDNLRPGVSEIEIAAAVESAICTQIGNDAIFHSRGWAMVQSGPNSAEAGQFNRSSARRLEAGDLVSIELATCVNGFWSDLTRCEAVGTLKPEAAEILALAHQAHDAAIDAIAPGAVAGEIDAIARNTIATRGFGDCFTHHTGHHVGFRYHDPGFMLFPGEAAKLESGMVLTVEPGIYVTERRCGARIEDNVLVTDSGHEVLSRIAG